MAVFRIEKTRDYTVMSNHHLRDMSAVAESQRGFFPSCCPCRTNWDYTMKGLSAYLQGRYRQYQWRHPKELEEPRLSDPCSQRQRRKRSSSRLD